MQNLNAKKAVNTKFAKKQKTKNLKMKLPKRNTIGVVKIATINNSILPIFSIEIKIDRTNKINVKLAKKPIKKAKIRLNLSFE